MIPTTLKLAVFVLAPPLVLAVLAIFFLLCVQAMGERG